MSRHLPHEPWAPTLLWRLLAVCLAVGGIATATALRSDVQRPSPPGTASVPGGPRGEPEAFHPQPVGSGRLLPDVFRVSDVDASPEGWVILDGQGGHASLVDTGGRFGPTVGRRGDGPGELRAPIAVARSGSAIGVLDASGLRLDVFPADTAPPFRVSLAPAACPAAFGVDLDADATGWIVLRRCLGTAQVRVEVLRVALLGGHSKVLDERALGPALPLDPFLGAILFTRTRSDVYLGSTRTPCLTRIEGTGERELCLESGPPVPLTDSLRRLYTGWAERSERAGFATVLPSHLPPWLEVRDAGHALAVLRPSVGSGEGWVLIETGREHVIEPPNGTRVEPGPAGLLLLRHEPEGVRAWIVASPGG